MTTNDKIFYSAALLFAGLSALAFGATVLPVSIPTTNQNDHAIAEVQLPVLQEAATDPSAYASINQRPIFVADRKPHSAAAKVDLSSFSTGTTPFSLIGIILTDGKKLAAIRRQSDKEETTLAVGQSIDGWSVVDIKANAVFLQSGDSKRVLRLADDKNKENP